MATKENAIEKNMLETIYGSPFEWIYKYHAINGPIIFHKLTIEALIHNNFHTWLAHSFEWIEAILGFTVPYHIGNIIIIGKINQKLLLNENNMNQIIKNDNQNRTIYASFKYILTYVISFAW